MTAVECLWSCCKPVLTTTKTVEVQQASLKYNKSCFRPVDAIQASFDYHKLGESLQRIVMPALSTVMPVERACGGSASWF